MWDLIVSVPDFCLSFYFGSFRGYPVQGVDQRGIFPVGPCFACGEANHIRRPCPYIKSASTPQQPELPAKK